MKRFRASLAAVIALALAALPVPAASMQATMAAGGTGMTADMAAAGAEMTATHDGAHDGAHCCPQTQDCDRPANKTGCDHSGACALKCTTLSADTVASLDVPPHAAPQSVHVKLADRLIAAPTLPQLPPPRL